MSISEAQIDAALDALIIENPHVFVSVTRENIAVLLEAAERARQARTPSGENALSLLSGQERKIAELLVNGVRLPSVAKSLYISMHTVRNHLKHAFKKLDVHSQVELVARCR